MVKQIKICIEDRYPERKEELLNNFEEYLTKGKALAPEVAHIIVELRKEVE